MRAGGCVPRGRTRWRRRPVRSFRGVHVVADLSRSRRRHRRRRRRRLVVVVAITATAVVAATATASPSHAIVRGRTRLYAVE